MCEFYVCEFARSKLRSKWEVRDGIDSIVARTGVV